MVPLKYNVRSLFVRKGTTFMTVGSIAFVVLVYVGVLALAGGLKTAFAASGDEATVIVLRDGARSETESNFDLETFRILATVPGVERGADGAQLASGEKVELQILQRKDGSESNVTVRGVDGAAFALRAGLRMVEGRRFEAGKGEIAVGSRLVDRYGGLGMGEEIRLGRMSFRVVGVFDSDDAYASEIWGANNDIGEAFRRTGGYRSARLRAASPAAAEALLASVKADQRLRVEPMLETEYYARQTEQTASRFVVLGNVLAAMMAFGACFAAANTMYAQVAVRGREIGTLRAIGYRRRQIVVAFVIEAVVLGLLAGAVGLVAAQPLNLVSAGTVNSLTFSEVSFSLRTTVPALTGGVVLAVVTGLVGGFLPAWSASRRHITSLLREA